MLLVEAGWLDERAATARGVVETAVRDAQFACETQVVDSVAAARQAARQATTDKRYMVVAIGDDALIHGVVNGMVDLDEPGGQPGGVSLGLVGIDASSGFVRTFGLDRSPSQLVKHLVGTSTMPIDLLQAHWKDTAGQLHRRIVANMAIIGSGVEVASRVNRMPRALGPMRTVLARWAVRGAARQSMHVVVDAASSDEPLSAVVVANGQFTAGGLHLSPRSIPTDGRIEVQTWRRSATYMARRSHRLANGRHLQGPDTRVWSTASVEVTSERPLALRIDEIDVGGATDIRLDVMRAAVELKL